MFFDVGIKDFIDSLLVAFVLYYTYKLMKASGSIKVFTGILVFILEPRAVDVVVGHVAGQTEPFDHGLRVGVEVLRVGLEVDSSAGNLHLCVLAQEEG